MVERLRVRQMIAMERKMIMKKSLCFLAGMVLLLAAACSGAAPAEQVSEPQQPESATSSASDSTEQVEETAVETSNPEQQPTPDLTHNYDVFGASSSTTPLVIRNGLLIDGTGADPIPDAVLVIEQGHIVAVGEAGTVEIPEGAEIIDAQGGTILPGIIDAHTHVLDRLRAVDGEPDEIYWTLNLVQPLQAGLTTMRDVGSHYASAADIAWLKRQLAGYGNMAPRVVMTGPILSATESPWRELFASSNLQGPLETPEQVRATVAALAAAGVDQIKIVADRWSDESSPTLTEDLVRAIVAAAHEHGVWVTAHSEAHEAGMVLASGVDQLAHWPVSYPLPIAEAMQPELMQDLLGLEVPVVSTFNLTVPYPEDVRRFLDSGGVIAMGTDAPGTGPLLNYSRELEFMVRFEMTAMEAIVASTANAAEVLGLGDQLGTLEVGMLADVIVVPGNPLEDIMEMREVVLVIRGGEVVFSASTDS